MNQLNYKGFYHQSWAHVKNKICSCGEKLDQAKKAERVRYWIDYYLPGGKRRREPVGYSIKEAQAAEGKKKGQKKENRLFDILPESKVTFADTQGRPVHLVETGEPIRELLG